MKAAVLHSIKRPLEIEDVASPTLKPDEVLVKTEACGICRTDLHIKEGNLKPGKIPLILGHEAVGTVERTGANITRWKKGDRVVPYRYFTCGKCYSCITGSEEVCYNYIGQLGFNWDGGYAEYFKVPQRYLVRLPDSITFQDGGTLACAGQTAYHAIRKRARVKLGQNVLITGLGGVGLQALQFAKTVGANVFIADRSEEKLKFAKKYNPDYLLNLNAKRLPDRIKELTGGIGVDAVIDTTAAGNVMKVGLKSLKKLGKLVLLGSSDESVAEATSTNMLVNEYEILGSRSSTKHELMEAAAVASSGKIKSIVTETYRIDEVNEALDKLKKRQIIGRAILTF